MKKVSGIYQIKNICNDKVYIGQSSDILKRFYNHKSELKRNKHTNKHLQRAWNTYGQNNFSFDILEECEIVSLDEREKWYISFTKSSKTGYNHSVGICTICNLPFLKNGNKQKYCSNCKIEIKSEQARLRQTKFRNKFSKLK